MAPKIKKKPQAASQHENLTTLFSNFSSDKYVTSKEEGKMNYHFI
jgi:hypothetical protein